MTIPLLFALFLLQDPDVPAAAPTAASGSAIVEMVHNSGPVALGVLILLALASVFSWTIMFSKWRSFSLARKRGQGFIRAFRKSSRLSEIAAVSEQFVPSPLVHVFSEIHDEYQRQSGGRGLPRNPLALERAAQTASSEALTLMERRLTWLATIANTATFIGLFGTVWGIIYAFHNLGLEGSGTLKAVAPGISEALITTAAGLLVAVPAVIGYNQLTAQLRDFAARMDDFGRELLNAIENAAMVATSPDDRADLRTDPRNDPRSDSRSYPAQTPDRPTGDRRRNY
jgi:biopolymer transport protein TolQ